MKVRFIIIASITIFLFLFFLIITSSYENIYIYGEKYILLNTKNGNTTFTFHNDNSSDISGTLEIVYGKINFVVNDKTIATGVYTHSNKTLVVDGVFDKKYKNMKFKQVTTMSEYFKTVF